MTNSVFSGVGTNPDGPDLPLGLGMRLAQDPKALTAFGAMSNTQKESLVRYVQGGRTGADAQERMAGAVQRLHDNQTQF